MSLNWSIATFPRRMSLYEFKLEMEFCGFSSENAEKFYKVYIDDIQAKKSKQRSDVQARSREQRKDEG